MLNIFSIHVDNRQHCVVRDDIMPIVALRDARQQHRLFCLPSHKKKKFFLVCFVTFFFSFNKFCNLAD